MRPFRVVRNVTASLFRVSKRGNATKKRKCLVVNAGSSSLKLEVVNEADEIRVLSDMNEVHNENVDCVVHRVVHGGEIYNEASIVNEKLLKDVEELSALAPLHNPVAVEKMREAMEVVSNVPHVACFDTAFHTKTMSEVHYRYAIPSNRGETKRIRKYGFHGLNHQYTSREAAKRLGLLDKSSTIVVAHLGNGASVCAVRDGMSVNTSMGFTPLEGLMMGTRCGSIDPSIVFYLHNTMNMSINDIDRMLHRESGLLGVSEISHDMRQIELAASNGDERAELALDMFCTRVSEGIAQMLPALKRPLDALVFTGGIGEHSNTVRLRVCEKLVFLDKLDCIVIPANESIQMVTEARALLR